MTIGNAAWVHRGLTLVVAVIMAVDLALMLLEAQWQNAFLLIVIMAIILLPASLHERLTVRVPAEFQLLALIFSFAALFLGEVRSYYARIWWWDLALHASSGLLLGIVGFLLVYMLNESRRIDLHMQPRFVALFAFMFAVAVGTLWEIFEFAMDRTFGLNMQKPMFGDESGIDRYDVGSDYQYRRRLRDQCVRLATHESPRELLRRAVDIEIH